MPKEMIEMNSTVLVASCYETTTQARQILLKNNFHLDVAKYERDDAPIIIDSMEDYLGKDKGYGIN